MVGSALAGYPTYLCVSAGSLSPVCRRRIAAGPLEALVAQEAVSVLASRAVPDRSAAPTAPTPSTAPALTQRAMDRGAPARTRHRGISRRPDEQLDTALIDGNLTLATWDRIPPRRQAAILRLLVVAVRIARTTAARNTFDPTRVHLLARPVHA